MFYSQHFWSILLVFISYYCWIFYSTFSILFYFNTQILFASWNVWILVQTFVSIIIKIILVLLLIKTAWNMMTSLSITSVLCLYFWIQMLSFTSPEWQKEVNICSLTHKQQKQHTHWVMWPGRHRFKFSVSSLSFHLHITAINPVNQQQQTL